jgi:hypothetical protein
MTLQKSRLMTLFQWVKGLCFTETFLLLVGSLAAFATIVALIVGHTPDQIVKITGQQSSVFLQSMR